ncbi:hypothetical protein PMAYCL1PPCAC_20012, partial [Pristionchus mayeri]
NQIIGTLQDWLSLLPGLCLLEIFSHLRKIDVFNIKTANRRIFSLACDRSLEKVKWKIGMLFIAQIPNGYGFSLCIRSNQYIRGEKPIFQYEILADKKGRFKEKKLIIDK